MTVENDDDYESAFSFEGLTGVEEEPVEPQNQREESRVQREEPQDQIFERITATLDDFPVNNWNSKNDAQHIVDWYNDLATKRGIETLSFRKFMKMTGNRHFDSDNDAQDFLDFALIRLNGEESDREWHHIESDHTPGEGTWAGLALFWVITLVFCVASAFVTVWIGGTITADLGTADWTPVEGVVTDSGVETSSSDEGGTTYCLWVEYDYIIENRTYDGSTLSYSKEGNCDSWSSNADDEYPPGKNVTVYVNPDNHDESVLLPGWSGIDFFMCCFLIFPLIGIVLFGFCCVGTYKSFMYPEKYIAGNFVPGDTSADESHTSSSSVDSDGDGLPDGLFQSNSNSIIDNIFGGVKSPAEILKTLFALLVVNGFIFAAFLSEGAYDAEFDVANEAMEGTSEWPTTTAWFSENFTFNSLDSGEYFGGSIIIYCLNTSESWECGDNESGYDRIEIPYRCTQTEQVGPLENPCDWAMQMFVQDSYFNGFARDEVWGVGWEAYENCKWEGEPDDENRWSCYYSNGETYEYDTWWYYCEHNQNQSIWYCTDELGYEISSPDNQNGTEYSPPVFQTTVNYDPDDPTRIAFVDQLEWHTESGDFPIMFLIFPIIINLVLISRIVVPIIRRHEEFKSSD